MGVRAFTVMRWLVPVLVLPLSAAAHDVGLELTANGTRATEQNPRTGSAGATVTGSVDVTDSLSFLGSFGMTRDFATRTADTASTGSTIGLATLGTMYLPTDTTMLMLSAAWGPPAQQLNATTVTVNNPLTGANVQADVVIRSVTSSVGLQLAGAWMSSGDGPVQSSVDVSVGATRFATDQQVQVPDTPRGRLLLQRCANDPGAFPCGLLQPQSTTLVQTRLGAGYTATVKKDTDVIIDAALYLYDKDPTQVGYFSTVVLGREVDLGNGLPVLPFVFTARASGLQRLGKVALKMSYQLGLYVSGLGVNHLLSVRASYELSDVWRLMATLSAQGDGPKTGKALDNQGGSALLGVTAVF